MEKQQKLTLIEGEFTLHESREILINIFLRKLDYHRMKNFSSQERFGIDDKIAIKRIPQIQKSIEKILKIVASAEKNGDHLSIHSDVSITITKPKKLNESKPINRKSK